MYDDFDEALRALTDGKNNFIKMLKPYALKFAAEAALKPKP